MKGACALVAGLVASCLATASSAAVFSGFFPPGAFGFSIGLGSGGPPVRVELFGDFSNITGTVSPIAEYSFASADPDDPSGVHFEVFDHAPIATDPIEPGFDHVYDVNENSSCDPLRPAGFCLYEQFDSLEFEGFNAGAATPFTVRTTVLPEPSTWALTILGFGAAGAALRRRRPQAVAVNR